MSDRNHEPAFVPIFVGQGKSARKVKFSSWKRTWDCFIFVAISFALSALPAIAQETPAHGDTKQTTVLQGTVSTSEDNSNSVLAGVALQLFSDPPTGPPRAASTDEQGHYEFSQLAPGNYTISVELQGFKRLTRAVVVDLTRRNVLDFVLEFEKVTEKVEVTDAVAPIASQTAAAPVAKFSNEQLRTLPTADEKVKEILPVTPGVIRTLDGKLVFKGSEEEQSLLLVNAARTTDPCNRQLRSSRSHHSGRIDHRL